MPDPFDEGLAEVRLSGFKIPANQLSATALGDFLSCPERFRQERVVKIPKRVYTDAFIGRVFHDTVAASLQEKMTSGKLWTPELLESAFHYVWATEVEKEGEPVWTENPEIVERLGLKMLDTFLANVAPTIDPIAVEQRFEERIPGLPVPLVGYIDCEEQRVMNEFKSAKQKVSAPKPNWRFQARVYQLVVRKPMLFTITTKQKTPVNWTWAECPDLRLEIQNPDVTVRMIVQAVEMLNDFYARYGPSNPWPTTGLMHQWLCDYCSAGPKNPNPTCPAWKGNNDAIAA